MVICLGPIWSDGLPEVFCPFSFIYCVLPLADVIKWGLVRLTVSSNSFVSMIYLVGEIFFVVSDWRFLFVKGGV